jgi:glucosyl-dolichyl phosphate glucuronosyltransferase
VKISVILCSYNRANSLATALESIAASQMPATVDWELLVVDNNSKDQTRDVVEEFVRRFPSRCRYLFEPRQGKSYALNTGVREARGEILAFVDDDVTVDTKWLQNLSAVFKDEQWAGAGGRILPERNFIPPAWLSIEGRYALAPLAIFSLGTQPDELLEPPFGTNMAFRAEVFADVGDFRTDLGPRPDSELRGEDTEFGMRVLAAGYRLWYEPSAIVYHSLPLHRLEKDYFLAWWYDKARADVRAAEITKRGQFCLSGVPLSTFRRLVVWTFRWIISVRPAQRFSYKLKVWSLLGVISEFHRMSRESQEFTVTSNT